MFFVYHCSLDIIILPSPASAFSHDVEDYACWRVLDYLTTAKNSTKEHQSMALRTGTAVQKQGAWRNFDQPKDVDRASLKSEIEEIWLTMTMTSSTSLPCSLSYLTLCQRKTWLLIFPKPMSLPINNVANESNMRVSKFVKIKVKNIIRMVTGWSMSVAQSP